MADVWCETVACQQGVGLLSAPAWVSLPTEGRSAPFHELARGVTVGIEGCVLILGRTRLRLLGTVGEHLGDGLVRHALELQLAA